MNLPRVLTAIVTPFVDNQIDYDSFLKLVDNQLSENTGIVLFGTTGECPTVETQEKKQILSTVFLNYTKFIDNMTQLKEKQLELFQNTEWIEKNIEEIIPISIEKISPTALSQSEINELYKSLLSPIYLIFMDFCFYIH